MVEGAALTQLGVGGIFAVLVIREVLYYLGRKNGVGPYDHLSQSKDIQNLGKMKQQIHDLHEWHKPEYKGIKVWYTTNISETLKSQLKATEEQTLAIKEPAIEVSRLHLPDCPYSRTGTHI